METNQKRIFKCICGAVEQDISSICRYYRCYSCALLYDVMKSYYVHTLAATGED